MIMSLEYPWMLFGRVVRCPSCIQQFLNSLAIKSTAKAHNNLAYVLERQGKTEEAIREYGKAIALDPDNEEALFNMGLVLLKNWRAADSIKFFQRVSRLNPGNIKAKENLIRARRMARAGRGAE